MRAIGTIIVVTVGLITAAALMAGVFILLGVLEVRVITLIAAKCVPMFCGLFPAGALYFTTKSLDFPTQKYVVPPVCLISMAAIPLSAAFAQYGSRRFLEQGLTAVGVFQWIFVGTVFALLALWQARRMFSMLCWVPAEQRNRRQPNQALQTTSVTRSGFGKVPVSDRHRRGV